MARIRVNTEDLKNKAKDFDSAAEAFNRAGDDILAAAMSMPSYDGQLSGPARKVGYEIQKQARELSTALSGDAESLRKTAHAFEEVDNQTIKSIEDNIMILADAPLCGGPGGETDDLGGPTVTTETKTEWDGSVTVITIEEEQWTDGTVVSTYTQTNTKTFSEAEVEFWDTLDIIRDAIIDAMVALIFSGPKILKWGVEFLGIMALTSIANIWGNLDSHDLPKIEPGDTRVITHVGKVVINPDGSSTAVWESKIEIFDASGNSKGIITGTYEK